MDTLQEINAIFEARKEKQISSKIDKFNSINEMIQRLKDQINELEKLKYEILLK
jgi:hypothetical protein